MNRLATPVHSPRASRRGGFVTVTALGLLAMAAVAAVMLAELTSADLRYTQQEAAETQLRLLLDAGERDARAAIASDRMPIAPLQVVVPCPPDGPAMAVTITFADTPDGRRVATILASIGTKTAGEEVIFARRGDLWTMTSARLASDEPPAPPHQR